VSVPRLDVIAGWRLAVYDTLPSTSDLVRERAAAGEPDGLAVLALRQTAARGSRGRDWSSPIGNLSLSLLLRPDEPARTAAEWSLLAAVALAETLLPLVPARHRVTVKWPNDVQLDGVKIAGILLDSAADGDGRLEWLSIGIGVNLAVAPTVPDRPTACLADVTVPPAPEAFAHALLGAVRRWRQARAAGGFAPVREAWLAYAAPPGTPATLRLGGQQLFGHFAGLGEDGALLLETEGEVRRFVAGEVLG
jgi:BirA family transcriptional regulator, biotin operon repressor / biotin---[acetyl-CoA-carboxylase] ligase